MAHSVMTSTPQLPAVTTVPDAADRGRSRRTPAVPQVLSVILAAWLMISPFLIRYPFTVDGQDALLRDMGFSLALLFTSVAWTRAGQHGGRFQMLYAVLAALLVVEAFAFGGGPGGRLAGASWNELVVGALMVVVTAAGWWSARTGSSPRLQRSAASDDAIAPPLGGELEWKHVSWQA